MSQATSTERLRASVYNEAIPTEDVTHKGPVASLTYRVPISHKGTTAPTATRKPIGEAARNDIFVDIIERLNVLFGSDGRILNHSIDGSIQVIILLHFPFSLYSPPPSFRCILSL